MRAIHRGFRSFRRNFARNLIVIVLLFVCLTFSMSMLAVKLAADSQVQTVKETVGNYGEIKVSSEYQMKQFEAEREKSAADRAAEARSMTSEEELADRVSTLVPETLTDEFSEDGRIKTYDKVLQARISLPDVESSDVQQAFQFRDEQRGGPGGSSSNSGSFTFSGNANGASASDFTTGAKRIVTGELFTYDDYLKANPVVVIEENLAETNDLSVGDRIEAEISGAAGKSSSMDLTVVGIYETVESQEQDQSGSAAQSFNPAGSTFYAPVSVVQKLNGTPGYLSLGSYYYDSADDSAALTREFKQLTSEDGDKYQFATDKADYNEIAEPLLKARNTAVIGLAGALGACALVILLAMVIIVSGRTRELGVLKAIGSRDTQVFGQFAFEIVCICLVAIVFAMGATAIIGQQMGNWLLPKASGTASSSQTTPQGPGGGPGGAPGMMGSGRLYKSGTSFVGGSGSSTTQAAKLNVVYRGSLFLYGIGILVLISLIGMTIPLLWIIRLRPARVLSME